MQDTTFTAVLYDDIRITIANQKTCGTPEDAICFAKMHQYDQVIRDETGEIIWQKGDWHSTWPKERFSVKEPGKDITHFFTTLSRATNFAKEL